MDLFGILMWGANGEIFNKLNLPILREGRMEDVDIGGSQKSSLGQ